MVIQAHVLLCRIRIWWRFKIRSDRVKQCLIQLHILILPKIWDRIGCFGYVLISMDQVTVPFGLSEVRIKSSPIKPSPDSDPIQPHRNDIRICHLILNPEIRTRTRSTTLRRERVQGLISMFGAVVVLRLANFDFLFDCQQLPETITRSISRMTHSHLLPNTQRDRVRQLPKYTHQGRLRNFERCEKPVLQCQYAQTPLEELALSPGCFRWR